MAAVVGEAKILSTPNLVAVALIISVILDLRQTGRRTDGYGYIDAD